MSTLTTEQQAARAVGTSKGVPEEFAIDCKAVALVDIAIGTRAYKKGDKNVAIYDSRERDFLRKRRLIVVRDDAFLVTNQTPAATIPSVATVNTAEDDHGKQSDTPSTSAPSSTGGTGALYEPGGEQAERSAPTPARGGRGRRSGSSR